MNSKRKVYFDNAASTPMLPEVLETMMITMQEAHGNPSSIHYYGRHARSIIEDARKTVAQSLKASIGEIFFTSGGTEANNMALICAVRDLGIERIISSPLEHHCVLHTLQYLADQGIRVEYLETDRKGHPSLEQLSQLVSATSESTLVSLMHANNEVGTIADLKKVSEICREHGAFLHSDTVQTIGHVPIDLTELYIHFITGSAHKFHGPKGTGFLYINSDIAIKPMIHGGAQERNMRAGTENIAGIAGMATALRMASKDLDGHETNLMMMKRRLMEALRSQLPDVQFNGDLHQGLSTILSVTFPASQKSELLLFNLDIEGISASGGSACASGTQVQSHVLAHLRPDDPGTTIRFSFSPMNTIDEIDYLISRLKKVLA